MNKKAEFQRLQRSPVASDKELKDSAVWVLRKLYRAETGENPSGHNFMIWLDQAFGGDIPGGFSNREDGYGDE